MPSPHPLAALYRPSLALATDLYQLTMAYGYWKAGVAEREAVFHLTFRRAPFGGGYAIAAGIEPALDFLAEHVHFDDGDLAYLATLRGADGEPLFEPGLPRLPRRACASRARSTPCPRARSVFPHEPLVRVTGPIVQAQIVETPLLAQINYQTLVATKAARVCQAARGRTVLEFGLRRAQGLDGGLAGVARRVHRRRRRRPRTCSPASSTASRSAAPTPTRGSCSSTTSGPRSGPTPTRCPTTARSWSTPTTRWAASATRSRSGASCAPPATPWSGSASTPATWPTCRPRPGACSTTPASPTPRSSRRTTSTST